jgi:hypothetical protein
VKRIKLKVAAVKQNPEACLLSTQLQKVINCATTKMNWTITVIAALIKKNY